MFKQVEVVPEPEVQVEAVQESADGVTEVQSFTAVLEVESFDFSVADGNLTILNVAIRDNDYTAEELNGLLAYELSNKNRTTAVSAIEGAIAELNE